MEVHHHSHHPKKWKEYITEFLMLFLAVTLGFLAENLREHQVVIERKNQNIEAMVTDLKKDSVSIAELTTMYTTGIQNLEDMSYASLQYQNNKISKKEYLTYMVNMLDTLRIGLGFFQNNSAYKNLISTGGLSVIKSTAVKKLISEYYEAFGIKLLDNNRLLDVDGNEFFNRTSIFGYGYDKDTSIIKVRLSHQETLNDFITNTDFEKSITNPSFRMYTYKFIGRCGYFSYLLSTCKQMNEQLLKEFEKKEY